ncbi:hypothetical protein Tco_0616555 [Tanacetum coccineum]
MIPHHTPTIINFKSNLIRHKKPRKPRKDTRVPQPSDPTKSVADEVVHKELGNSLVRAATTSFSLKAEQDNGNINKSQSKATPNESSSLGTTLVWWSQVLRNHGDTIAQTRFESVSKHSMITASQRSTVGGATIVSAATTTTGDDGDITLVQALIEMKSTKTKKKGVVIREWWILPTIISSQQS